MSISQVQPDAEVAVSILHGSTHTVVKLSGEIDIATTPVLRERLFDVVRQVAGILVIDLSGVSFSDASGLAVMVGTQHRARSHGIAVRLASPRPPVTKLLGITGLDRRLNIYPTLRDALLGEHHSLSTGR